MERAGAACCCLVLLAALAAAGPRYSSRIVHTHAGAIRGIIVEPASRRLEPVEVFLGVPYAGVPERLAAPPPPAPWPGTRLADAHAPVCPQRYPDVRNRSAALARMPLGVYNELKATVPLLANQSEDCLYLNIYVPGSGARGEEAPYAVVVWVGGPSHEWGAAAAIDGAVLAARAHLLVLTLNYRLGLLGFVQAEGSAGGAAMQDVASALRWVRDNIRAFGGDPRRVTLAGHAAGAALAHALLLLPETKGLVSRALLLSGTAASPTAFAPDAALAREHAAQALRCGPESGDGDDRFAACVRARPLAALLAVEAPRARFLPGWAPAPPAAQPAGAFLDCALAVVVATTESYRYFPEDDIRHGFEEEHRNRVLRTYVRNVYRYHRNEIFAAIRNEYTDWEKPIQHPINIRDATLEALSDGAAAAPALRLARHHARRGAPTYFAHFAHQTRDADYPQRLGSVTGETLAYFLGLPLVGGGRNYSRADAAVADAAVALLAALAKSGEPAPPAAWPRYDLAAQHYLSIGAKQRVRSHYRGHKMALWLHLIPQLHRPGAAAAHHQFRDEHPDSFAGEVFPELGGAGEEEREEQQQEQREQAGRAGRGSECEPSPAPRPAAAAPSPPPQPDPGSLAADTHYYSYTVALGVTVGAGCFLLALNVLVFAAVYAQRARRAAAPRRPGGSRGAAPPDEPSTPRKSTLKRSCASGRTERAAAAGERPRRVHIQEISV